MNAPAAIVISKILIPETQPDQIKSDLHVSDEQLGCECDRRPVARVPPTGSNWRST